MRVGKYIQTYLEAETRTMPARDRLDVPRLLANPVIEDYTFKMEEADADS